MHQEPIHIMKVAHLYIATFLRKCTDCKKIYITKYDLNCEGRAFLHIGLKISDTPCHS